jgi:hypothetical protein
MVKQVGASSPIFVKMIEARKRASPKPWLVSGTFDEKQAVRKQH